MKNRKFPTAVAVVASLVLALGACSTDDATPVETTTGSTSEPVKEETTKPPAPGPKTLDTTLDELMPRIVKGMSSGIDSVSAYIKVDSDRYGGFDVDTTGVTIAYDYDLAGQVFKGSEEVVPFLKNPVRTEFYSIKSGAAWLQANDVSGAWTLDPTPVRLTIDGSHDPLGDMWKALNEATQPTRPSWLSSGPELSVMESVYIVTLRVNEYPGASGELITGEVKLAIDRGSARISGQQFYGTIDWSSASSTHEVDETRPSGVERITINTDFEYNKAAEISVPDAVKNL